jgi:hypothetical protein
MAILVKTASVRVSCIQNTQIRGIQIAKVFGKVHTFWTYQYTRLGRSLKVILPQVASKEVCETFSFLTEKKY